MGISICPSIIPSSTELSCIKLTINVCFTSVFCFLFWFIGLSLCHYHSLDPCSFYSNLKLESMSPSTFFFFKIILAIQSPFHFHLNSEICLPISAKTAANIMVEIIRIWINLGMLLFCHFSNRLMSSNLKLT
jgi:hypothetical protein